MKGKFFKRLFSTMLSLMFMFTAFKMTAFAEEFDPNATTATVTYSDLDNDDDLAADKEISFHLYLMFQKTGELNASGTVKINKFKVSFGDVNEIFKDEGHKFEKMITTNADGAGSVADHVFTYELNLPAEQAITFELNRKYDFAKFTGKVASAEKATAAKAGFKIKNSKDNTVLALEDKNAANPEDAETTLKAHAHTYNKKIVVNKNETEHTLKCDEDTCTHVKTEPHNFVNPVNIAATEEHLGGTSQTCSGCNFVSYTDLLKKDNTTPALMPDGKTAISSYSFLNQVALDINGNNIVMQDALNLLAGKKLALTAAEADNAALKQISDKIAAKYGTDGLKVYTLALTADGKAVAADTIKKGIRVLYEIPAGFTLEEYTDVLKLAGVTGDFDATAEKINDKQYLVVWTTLASSPYVVLNKAGAAANNANTANTANNNANKATTSTSGKSAKTGDTSGLVCLVSSGLLVVAGLYMELMKKKKNA